MPDVQNNSEEITGPVQDPVQTPRSVISSPLDTTQANAQIPEAKNIENSQIKTKIPKSAFFALITSISYLFLMILLRLLIPNILNFNGTIASHSGTFTTNAPPGLMLTSSLDSIAQILILVNIVLGIDTILKYRKSPNKITLAIGVFAIAVGILPILGLVILSAFLI